VKKKSENRIRDYLNGSFDRCEKRWRTKVAKKLIKKKDFKAVAFLIDKSQRCKVVQ
jgi:hypothetical protein